MRILKRIFSIVFCVCILCSSLISCGSGVPKELKDEIDFVVKVAKGKNPVILHIADPQIIDSSQMRSPDRIDAQKQAYWSKDSKEERFFKYLRETVNATNPDLILVTGDLVYGEFDDDGSCFKAFVKEMDSFGIPWAPVFGNHDNESNMGVDWQCKQLVKAKHCLFKQRTLVGNGNYTVGISQGGKITRVFFMMDTNGCGNASEKTLENYSVKRTVGFGDDQIDWFYVVGKKINEILPETKISFGIHIQMMAFENLYAKYGIDSENVGKDVIDIDKLPNKADGDFGLIGVGLGGAWDMLWGSSFTLMQKIGVDSIFVGHEHSNSASVVVDGVRFQFGQKISTYDSCNWLTKDGKIIRGSAINDATPLVGGTVNVLNEKGEFIDGYIYLCKNH